MIVTIHQPEHLPWLGFFDKARQADLFVLLDNVPFRKNYFQNRNRLLSAGGPIWVTVPVYIKGKSGQLIEEVRISNDKVPRWKEKYWNSIVQCYRKATFFQEHAPFFENVLARPWDRLVELNHAILTYLLRALQIDVKLVRASTLGVEGTKSDLLLDICSKVGGTVYLSGISGRDYLDLALFAEAGVEVRFQAFHHPIYRQLHQPFAPLMSVADLLFGYGPESLAVIEGVGVDVMDHVFE